MTDISGKHSSPSRQCKICRQVKDKKELFRFSDNGDKLCPSEGRFATGRGIYFCRDYKCISLLFSDKRYLKNFLSRMSEDGIKRLESFMTKSLHYQKNK